MIDVAHLSRMASRIRRAPSRMRVCRPPITPRMRDARPGMRDGIALAGPEATHV